MNKTQCRVCNQKLSLGRIKLGIQVCLICGEAEAIREIGRKQARVIPLFNKGGYQYAGNDEQTKRAAQENTKAPRSHSDSGASSRSTQAQSDAPNDALVVERTGEQPKFKHRRLYYEGPPGKRLVFFERVPLNKHAREALDQKLYMRIYSVHVQR